MNNEILYINKLKRKYIDFEKKLKSIEETRMLSGMLLEREAKIHQNLILCNLGDQKKHFQPSCQVPTYLLP